ncbi:MAG: hypothetical protein COB98_03680 [Flavobacteriaceae bacterium]|nr:MAG: hypothetical protein COB98_03680 [Flavobacteriaceae bacterium]
MSDPKDSSYTILKELGLVIQCHTREISPEKGKYSRLKIYLDQDYDKKFMLLVDIRTTNFVSKTSELDIHLYADFLIEMQQNYGCNRTAVLTDNPAQVANSMRIISILKDYGMDCHIFSTLGAASNWLGIYNKDRLKVAESLQVLTQTLSASFIL